MRAEVCGKATSPGPVDKLSLSTSNLANLLLDISVLSIKSNIRSSHAAPRDGYGTWTPAPLLPSCQPAVHTAQALLLYGRWGERYVPICLSNVAPNRRTQPNLVGQASPLLPRNRGTVRTGLYPLIHTLLWPGLPTHQVLVFFWPYPCPKRRPCPCSQPTKAPPLLLSPAKETAPCGLGSNLELKATLPRPDWRASCGYILCMSRQYFRY